MSHGLSLVHTSILTRQQLVRHQVESYNDFIGCQIPKTINMFNDVVVHSEQDYVQILINTSWNCRSHLKISASIAHKFMRTMVRQLMFPNEARLRNFTYSANMTLDIDIKYIVRSSEQLETQQILHKSLQKIHW